MYRAKDTFWAPDNRRIVKGDLVAPHDLVLEGREELFEEVVIPTAVVPTAKPAAKKTAPAKKTAASKPAAEPVGDSKQGDPQENADGGDEE